MSWNAGQVLQIPVSDAEDDTRLDRWLKRRFPGLTQGQVEKLLRSGQIRVDGARAKSNTRLKAGQEVRVPPITIDKDKLAERNEARRSKPEHVSQQDAELIRSLVIHEDDDCIILNKPPGLAVQGGTKTARHVDGMSAALVRAGEDKPRLVHRLDRDTSGVLVLAKNAPAAASLGALFRSRELDKIYWAIVLGAPKPLEGQIRGWMIKSTGPGEDKEKMRYAEHGERGAVFSITDYATVSSAGQKAAWMALKPLTGRKHQLRLHMSQLGHSILGDRKYECDREAPTGVGKGLHLHARALRLPRKHGPALEVFAPLPAHIKTSFEVLGFSESEASNPFDTIPEMSKKKH